MRDLPGGVDEYLRLRAALAARATAPGVTRRRDGAVPVTAARRRSARAARKDLARIERRLGRLAEQRGALEPSSPRTRPTTCA